MQHILQTQKVETFPNHINSEDKNIRLTKEDIKNNMLPFMDCAVDKDGSIK